MTDTTTTPDTTLQTTLIVPMITAAIRWALTIAGARLGMAGLSSDSNVTMFAGAVLAVLPLVWSLYQKQVARQRVLIAAAAPADPAAQAALVKP